MSDVGDVFLEGIQMLDVICSDVGDVGWRSDIGCRRSDDIRQQMYDRKLDVQCSDVGCQMSGYRIILKVE